MKSDDRSPLPRGPLSIQEAERLASLPVHLRQYDIEDDDTRRCWVARRRRANGYSWATSIGRGWKGSAYKLIWEWIYGRVPDGLELDHICDNGPGGCVNPFHLEAVTHQRNVVRTPTTIPGQHARKTHCPQGHPYDEKNTMWERRKNGQLERHCRTCKNARTRAWMNRDREALKAHRRAEYAKNRDKILAQKQAWRDRKRAEKQVRAQVDCAR